MKPGVLRAADAYNLAPRLFEPRGRGDAALNCLVSEGAAGI
jgi:hypothetical protein